MGFEPFTDLDRQPFTQCCSLYFALKKPGMNRPNLDAEPRL